MLVEHNGDFVLVVWAADSKKFWQPWGAGPTPGVILVLRRWRFVSAPEATGGCPIDPHVVVPVVTPHHRPFCFVINVSI